jgi:predicted transcriptional regulator
LAGSQRDFPVADDGRVVGMLCQEDLMRALEQTSSSALVASAMRSQYQRCEPGDMLEGVFARIREDGAHTLPVLRGDRIAGLLTMDNIGEMLRIQAALDKRRGGDRLKNVEDV